MLVIVVLRILQQKQRIAKTRMAITKPKHARKIGLTLPLSDDSDCGLVEIVSGDYEFYGVEPGLSGFVSVGLVDAVSSPFVEVGSGASRV